MAKTQFLDYTIYLTDAARVAELQAGQHAGGAIGVTIIPPTQAATTYAATIEEESAPFVAPCIRSEWFTTGNNFPRDQRTFDRKSGGWFGIPLLFGTTTHYYWRGVFKWSPKIDATVAPTGGVKVGMAQRRWVDGAELPDFGENGSGNAGRRVSRAASRHLQGYGWKFDQTQYNRTHTPTESGGAATARGWDRFYLRVHRFPAAKVRLWKTTGAVSAGAGVELGLLPSGQLTITNIDAVGTESLIATLPAIPLHVWKKIDLIYAYLKGAQAPFFSVYVNGVNVAELAGVWGGSGLGQDQNIASVTIGPAAAHTGTFDIDDWVSADWPTGTSLTPSSVGVFPGLDWNNGSRVAMVSASAFGSDNAASWAAAGDWRFLRQRPVLGVGAAQVLSNVTAGARLCILTDANREIDNQVGVLGLAAMTVGIYSLELGSVAGSLGYRLPGGAAVMAAAAQAAGLAWATAMYRPTITDPVHPLAGLELLFDHGAAGTAEQVQFLGAACELIGQFGQEDLVPGATSLTAGIGVQTPAPSINDASQTVDYVTKVKAATVAAGHSIVGACGAFEIVKRVAWGLKHEGAGYLIKTTGNNCGGYAVDQVCFPSGRIVDVLGDAGNANTPSWSEGVDVTADRYHLPIDPGDAGTLQGPPEHLGIHNAPYPHSPWARRGAAPFSPVGIVSGTYVGTGTFLDLTFRFPVHFLIIRPTVAGSGGVQWFSSHVAGHVAGKQGYTPHSPVVVLIDPAFPVGAPALDAQEQQTVVRIVGNDADSNGAGVTYQYTAFCDPGMRFLMCGALDVFAGATDIVSALNNEGYTPEAVFCHQEIDGNVATIGLHYKGSGHAAGNISPLTLAEIAGLAMGRGTLTSKAALHANALNQIAYAVFRRNDGSGDANVGKVIGIASYIGDGAASRSIGVLMGGQRPVWALVVPHNGAAFVRDASHLGTTSTQFPATANAATGITGGAPDSVSVGIALNANGIGYDIFLLAGGTVAGNGGFSAAGEFIVIEPSSPTAGDVEGGGLWDADPPNPELMPDEPGTTTTTPTTTTGPTLPDGQTGTDFATACVAESTFIINQALSKIGVSKQIGNIVTELSKEAQTARLHYVRDVETTLRRFPWPFATRYARLVLVAGTSTVKAVGDWQYSYRAPADSLFNRRIVNPTQIQRAYDAEPVRFRFGTDATGDLIYTNQSPTDDNGLAPELEYTIRTTCAASQGDAMFREALIWQHAASLAPALAKDGASGAIAKFCLAMFERRITEAEVAAANEGQADPEGDAPWISGRDT